MGRPLNASCEGADPAGRFPEVPYQWISVSWHRKQTEPFGVNQSRPAKCRNFRMWDSDAGDEVVGIEKTVAYTQSYRYSVPYLDTPLGGLGSE